MNSGLKAFSSILAVLVGLGVFSNIALADPCLIVYPTGSAIYHYDVNEYYTVSSGDSLYDSMYDRGGEVLIDINDNEIAYNIYQSPNLIGFAPSTDGEEGYFFTGGSFDLIIDGFSNQPSTYENILLAFNSDPDWCDAIIYVDGQLVTGATFPLGNLTVSTPTPDGSHYSDTILINVTWSACYGVRIWAFADDNYNGVKDGGECFTAFSHDGSVPAEEITWGGIKSLYQE